MLISRAVSFLMLPIYLRYLTPADYGVMFLVEMTLDFISIVGGAQLALGVYRFYHKTDDEVEKKQVVSTSFILVGILYTVMGTATFAGASAVSSLIFGSDAQVLVIRIAAANLAANSLIIIPLAFARLEDRSALYVGANVGKLLLMVALNILFIVVMGIGILGIFLSSLLSNTVVGIALGTWLLRRVGRRASRRTVRDLVRYGVPLMGAQLSMFIATFSDRYFLQAVGDEVLVGLYGLAYQFGFLMAVVGFSPIELVWGPKRFDVAKGENRDEVLARGFVLMNVVLLTTAVGIVVYVEDVLRIMADPEFHSASAVVPIILIAYVFQCWSAVQDIGLLVKEKTKYLTLAQAAAAVVAVTGYTLLIPRYFEWGAAVATVIAFATRYGLTYWQAQRIWPVRYRWRPVWIILAWAVTISSTSLLVEVQGVRASLTFSTVLVIVYGLGLWLLPILDPAERAMVKSLAGALGNAVRSRWQATG